MQLVHRGGRAWRRLNGLAIEIWDETTRNAVGVFPTPEKALDFVRETIECGGENDVHDWMMDWPESGCVLRGQEIVDRAKGVAW